MRQHGSHEAEVDPAIIAGLNPRFDPNLNFTLSLEEVERRRGEIFRDAEPTRFIEWLSKQKIRSLIKDMAADIVSWFEMRENEEVGVPEFTRPSIAEMYLAERKSIGFLALQVRKERTSMYRLPLTRNDWADFISLVNERDLGAYDRLVGNIVARTGLEYWVRQSPRKWYQRKKVAGGASAREAAELLLMVRLGFEKGRSRPDMRPDTSEFRGRDASVYGLPDIDIDLDVIGRMFVTFPHHKEIVLDVRGDFEEQIRTYIRKTTGALDARQTKEFSDKVKIKAALKARGHDPASLPNYKQAIAFPKVLPIENRKIVRLEDYLEYGFGMSKLGSGTAFEDFIGQLAGDIRIDTGIDFGSVEIQFDRTRELVRSILGFSQHEDFVKILQRYVEQAVDNPEFGMDVARFRHEKERNVA